jgi:hypothetical protein
MTAFDPVDDADWLMPGESPIGKRMDYDSIYDPEPTK